MSEGDESRDVGDLGSQRERVGGVCGSRLASGCVLALCWLGVCGARGSGEKSSSPEKIMERISETRTAWNAWRGANESYNIHVYKAYMPILQIP